MLRLSIICVFFTYTFLQSMADPDESSFKEDEDLSQLRTQFEKFKETYNKAYEEHEEENRFQIFVENLKKAKEMQEQDRGTAEYGITKFSDMSDEEFNGFYFNEELSNASSWPKEAFYQDEGTPMTNLSCPRQCDWRKYGAVTQVKDQRKCGSCWAFAAVANIESMWYIKRKQLVDLSEQELLDCDTYDKACKGGYPYNAYNVIMKLGGVMRACDYKYVAARRTCRFRSTAVAAKIVTFRSIRSHECEMSAWIARNGPLVVTMNAAAMKGYKRGIARPSFYGCRPNVMNHVVAIVGYGVYRTYPYWIIKNSWGANWGEQGYFRIYRGEKACGLNQFPVSAIVN
ncbi:cathepsin F-like [Heptranchias perlo]|uniref:cathepsin F-like n=1 Tax=Heptranchias perlo TaxID=212740 RepID=UPI00355A710B